MELFHQTVTAMKSHDFSLTENLILRNKFQMIQAFLGILTVEYKLLLRPVFNQNLYENSQNR